MDDSNQTKSWRTNQLSTTPNPDCFSSKEAPGKCIFRPSDEEKAVKKVLIFLAAFPNGLPILCVPHFPKQGLCGPILRHSKRSFWRSTHLVCCQVGSGAIQKMGQFSCGAHGTNCLKPCQISVEGFYNIYPRVKS